MKTLMPHPSTLSVSVIVPAFNRADRLARLLHQFGVQTISPESFEVIIIDDGSTPPIAPRLCDVRTPFGLTVITRENGGPAAARHTGILQARGDLLVLVDDDMLVPPDFLDEHIRAHGASPHRVVLGHLRADPDRPLSLSECWRLRLIDRKAAHVNRGGVLTGSNMYSGNTSLRRADYFAAGGFDESLRLAEDTELGIRLHNNGVEFTLSESAYSWHAPDPETMDAWRRRAIAYGAAETRIGFKLRDVPHASPWRYLPCLDVAQRSLLLATVAAPKLAERVAIRLMKTASRAYDQGQVQNAMRITALAYAMLYYVGVRRELGSRRNATREWRRHLTTHSGEGLAFGLRWTKLWADLDADREALFEFSNTPPTSRERWLLTDLLEYGEVQSATAYRLMRFFRDVKWMVPAKVVCRLMRHCLATQIHWDADLAPGVVLRGSGIVAAARVRVGGGSLLSMGTTLDRSPDDAADGGVPLVERNVVIGPGAALLGPISVGEGAHVGARAVVTSSVPAGNRVDVPAPSTRPRSRSSRQPAPTPTTSHTEQFS